MTHYQGANATVINAPLNYLDVCAAFASRYMAEPIRADK